MNELNKKKEIIKYSRLFYTKNLSPNRSGNISLRHIKDRVEGFLISPSGKKNTELKVNDIVFVTMNGIIEKNKKPSSEWKFHLDIYKATNYKAIVHAHSKFAVICSCLYNVIPSFHYMIALTQSKKIKVAKYSLFGTEGLSKNILKAIEKSKSCLISNHGQVSIDMNLSSAFELAEEVEMLCEYYYYCMLQKKPKKISSIEMSKVLKKIFNYKLN